LITVSKKGIRQWDIRRVLPTISLTHQSRLMMRKMLEDLCSSAKLVAAAEQHGAEKSLNNFRSTAVRTPRSDLPGKDRLRQIGVVPPYPRAT
jgi:hypothetical protein